MVKSVSEGMKDAVLSVLQRFFDWLIVIIFFIGLRELILALV